MSPSSQPLPDRKHRPARPARRFHDPPQSDASAWISALARPQARGAVAQGRRFRISTLPLRQAASNPPRHENPIASASRPLQPLLDRAVCKAHSRSERRIASVRRTRSARRNRARSRIAPVQPERHADQSDHARATMASGPSPAITRQQIVTRQMRLALEIDDIGKAVAARRQLPVAPFKQFDLYRHRPPSAAALRPGSSTIAPAEGDAFATSRPTSRSVDPAQRADNHARHRRRVRSASVTVSPPRPQSLSPPVAVARSDRPGSAGRPGSRGMRWRGFFRHCPVEHRRNPAQAQR